MTTAGVMKLIVGLGNPGVEYAATRHNAGFMAVQRIAERHGLTEAKEKFHARTLEGRVADAKVMLMQPMTFMNRSGLAAGEAARFYRLEPADVMVIADDMALPLGMIRLRARGGDGGHNGLADVERALGSREYPRLRIGVGAPEVNGRSIRHTDHVLGRFTDEQRAALSGSLDRATDAVETWLRDGIDLAMTRYNQRICDPEP